MSDWDAGGERIPVERVPASGARGDRRAARDGTAAQEGEDLAALTAELEETLRTLRREVGAREAPATPARRGRNRPALPRPPSPREVLRFTESYTIPTVVAVLEAAIRGLELLAATIRLLDGRDPRPPDREGVGALADLGAGLGADAGDRAVETGRAALERVDEALAELQRTYEGEPEDPTARRLLDDARSLRSEIDERLAERAEADRDRGADPDRETDPTDGDNDERAAVDVEAELETLRRSVGRGDTDAGEPRDGGSTSDDEGPAGGDEADDDAGNE